MIISLATDRGGREDGAAAYPPLADLADALYWQAQGDDAKMQAYMAKCVAVKALYPKADVTASQ